MRWFYYLLTMAACMACAECSSKPAQGGDASVQPQGGEATVQDQGDAGAQASSHKSVAPVAPKADADTLFDFVKRQVECGPRVPGTAGHAACHDYIVGRINAYGGRVIEQDLDYVRVDGLPIHIRNIVGRFNEQAPRAILLVAHYDTRPWADAEPDPSLHSQPIDGANDGASGVAVLLEVARLASMLPDDVGIELLFVDQEDSGSHASDATWAVGSQAWAVSAMAGDRNWAFGILFDMVGGRDAVFAREYFSQRYAERYTDLIWAAADKAGSGDRFINTIGGAINDDHLPIIAAGIPCVDIIEMGDATSGGFNPTWHTLADNTANIDPLTLKAVADVALRVITDKKF